MEAGRLRGNQNRAILLRHVGGEHHEEEACSPEDESSFLSRFTFAWIYPTIRTANAASKLTREDLPPLPRADRAMSLYMRWKDYKTVGRVGPWGLVRALTWGIQCRLFLYSFLSGWMFLFLMTMDPLVLGKLLKSVQSADRNERTFGLTPEQLQLVLVLILSISMLIRVSCMEICFFASSRLMNNIRTVVVHAVFRRAMAIPCHKVDVGKLTNLMATDADKFGSSCWILFSLSQWTWAFLSLPVMVSCLYQLVGISALICTVTIILVSIFYKWAADCMGHYNRKVQEIRDVRSRMMNEMLRGIRVVKLQVWEPMWLERLTKARDEEMRALMWVRILNALLEFLGSLAGTAMPVSIFASYILISRKHLDAATAFTALAWINTLQWSIQTIPGAFQMYAYLKPSVVRINNFLSEIVSEDFVDQEFENPLVASIISLPEVPQTGNVISWPKIKLTNVSVGYHIVSDRVEDSGTGNRPAASDHTRTPPDHQHGTSFFNEGDGTLAATEVLSDVNLDVPSGQLVMIAGPVACGKSTLLAAMANATVPLKGTCDVHGSRAYAAQKPFLLNDTVRRNILFGLPYDESKYQDAIARSALHDDLRALVSGDHTVVGENGVQLSGGQKARVALARVMYADADVVFLDDVLSAVDAHTGRHLWDNCIIGGFKQSGKTTVLVSHQIQYLSRPEVDIVILLRAGQVWLQGPWSELTSRGDELLSFVNEWRSAADAEEEDKTKEKEGDAEVMDVDVDGLRLSEVNAALKHVLSSLGGRRVDDTLIDAVTQAIGGEREGMENMREGSITWPDFQIYLKSFGSWLTICFLLLAMVAGAVVGVGQNLWLSIWTNKPSTSPQEEHTDLSIYALFGVGTGVSSAAQQLLLAACALAASRKIHGQMLRSLLGAPLSFFDLSPTGRLLNRFLQDLQNIDNVVPNVISDQFVKSLSLVTQLSLIYVMAPWVLLTLPVLAIPYYAIFTRMRIANRDSRRIESVARSPVYAHFSDALHGRDTIRAFAAEDRFQEENMKQISTCATAAYGNYALAKWAQMLTTQWGCVLYFTCGIVLVGLTETGASSTGVLGLVLMYAGQLQRSMMDYMMGAAEVEKNFVSVERSAEYIRLEPEEPNYDPSRRPCDADRFLDCLGGPAIEIKDVELRYRVHRPLVLKGVTLHIRPGEKVAVCGRTGCGKSSLFGVLCRLYPIAAGSISIGGNDIAAVPLRSLRTYVRVVTQDAFLVSGSLRHNLALSFEDVIADDVLLQILQLVGMLEEVNKKGGLDCQIEDGGSNFSAGEKQLLTLARSLTPIGECRSFSDWRPPQVLLCDEATASVDLLADEKVHDVLLTLSSTVLVICHRLQHITRFSRVVVMDMGRVAEEGPPSTLLAPTPAGLPPTRLAQLCAEAGVTS